MGMNEWPAAAATAVLLVAVFWVVWLTTPRVERWARGRRLLDRPHGRHRHLRAVPRLGGVAVGAGLALAAVALLLMEQWYPGVDRERLLAVVAGGLVVWLIGLVDDLVSLPPLLKLAGQLAGSGLTVALGLRVEFVSVLPGPPWTAQGLIPLGPWAAPVTILWLVGVTNAVNLLDGLDGLASGVVAIAAVPAAFASALQGSEGAMMLLLALAAACAAFLRYNFQPARIFLGDNGALLLGFLFAGATAMGVAKGPAVMGLLVPVLSMGIPLADTAWAVVRRALQRRPVVQADLGHLHYRLLATGHSVRQVVLMLYGLTAGLGAVAVILTPLGRASLMASVVLAAVAVVAWGQSRWWVSAGQGRRRSVLHGDPGRDRLRYPS